MPGVLQSEGANWDRLDVPDWNGIGLTDPIKTVEVCKLNYVPVLLLVFLRTSGYYYQPSSKLKAW